MAETLGKNLESVRFTIYRIKFDIFSSQAPNTIFRNFFLKAFLWMDHSWISP